MALPDKVRVDLSEITFGELADALDAAGVDDLTKASGADQARANAAFAWVALRRDDPSITYEQILYELPVAAIEVVNPNDPGNVSSASDGEPPPVSLARGI